MTSAEIVGELLDGKWKIKSQLGVGGMGTVFLATDVSLERDVAVKFLSGRLLDNADALARFEREAKVMAKLDHQNLVPIHAFGRHAGAPYMVMKYVPGEPLSVRAARGLSLGDITALVAQLCDGLQHLHKHGVLHRDIKPSNIIVDADGHLTLLDFGVARPREGVPMTPSGSAVGTPRYMAPEQVLGKVCDHRVDLYAVGVLLFELTTGSGLFPGKGDVELLRAHVENPTPDPRSLNPTLPPGIAAVIARALAKNPDERFESAAQLKAALLGGLAPAAETQVAPPTPAPARHRKTEVIGSSFEEQAPTTVEPSLRRRRTRPIFVAFAALAVLGAGAWIWSTTPRPDPSPTPAPSPTPVEVPKVAPAPEPDAATTPPPDAATPSPLEPTPPPTESPRPTPSPKVAPKPSPAPAPVEVTVVATYQGKLHWGAFVDVDGVRKGKTVGTFDLPPGRHTIRITAEGFKPLEREMTVSPGKPQTLSVELQP